jgi:predicted phage-related endonuclease
MKDKILRDIKNSVGYSESKNKKEFLSGANVGIHNCELYYNEKLEKILKELESYKRLSNNLDNDLKQIVTIFNKYGSDFK